MGGRDVAVVAVGRAETHPGEQPGAVRCIKWARARWREESSVTDLTPEQSRIARGLLNGRRCGSLRRQASAKVRYEISKAVGECLARVNFQRFEMHLKRAAFGSPQMARSKHKVKQEHWSSALRPEKAVREMQAAPLKPKQAKCCSRACGSTGQERRLSQPCAAGVWSGGAAAAPEQKFGKANKAAG